MTVEVYEKIPDGFNASVEIAACFIEVDGQLLLLQRCSSKQEAGKWGVPAGKVEVGETPEETAQRELFEETAIVAHKSAIQPLGALYIRKPELDYICHLFQITLKTKPQVHLSTEHPNFLWANEEEVKNLPLMAGGAEALQKYRLASRQQKNSGH